MTKILLIEDDPSICKAITAALSGTGFDVIAEEDGLRGLNSAKQIKPDLLLLDVMLPSMNGFEICRNLKQSGYTFPVFMLTSLGDEDRRMEGFESGADEYIAKPFSIKELLLRISNTLAREEKIRERSRSLEDELKKAREIQINSLPKHPPKDYNLDICAKMEPASIVGGDYYDYIQLSGGRLGIIIADVCGKGMPAAMLVQKMQGIVCSLEDSHLDGREIFSFLFEHLKESIPKTGFVTASLFVYNKDNSAELYRAGHLPFIVRREGVITEIRPEGLWIGAVPHETFLSNIKCFKLDTLYGTTVMMLTDGVSECVNPAGEEYGIKRIKNFIANETGNSAYLTEALFSELKKFRSEIEIKDDTTIIIINGK